MVCRIATLLLGGIAIGLTIGAMLFSTLPVILGIPVIFAMSICIICAID